MTVDARTDLEDLSVVGLREPLSSLIRPFHARIQDASRVLVLPDVAYPFHPSTGMVTNPTVVEALVTALRVVVPNGRIGVALAGSEHAEARRSGRYLGYRTLVDRLGAEYVDLEGADCVSATARVRGTPRTVAVPRVLAECTLVNVPTLRTDRERGLVAGMANLARAADAPDPTPEDVVAVTRALDPAVTMLDGTYTHTGAPHRSGFLLAAGDATSLDRVAARLLGRGPDEIPHLRADDDGEPVDPTVRRSVEAVRSALPNETPPAPFAPGPAMRLGYRTYARITGDAVPPQFLDE